LGRDSFSGAGASEVSPARFIVRRTARITSRSSSRDTAIAIETVPIRIVAIDHCRSHTPIRRGKDTRFNGRETAAKEMTKRSIAAEILGFLIHGPNRSRLLADKLLQPSFPSHMMVSHRAFWLGVLGRPTQTPHLSRPFCLFRCAPIGIAFPVSALTGFRPVQHGWHGLYR